jgi:hypothetical protein
VLACLDQHRLQQPLADRTGDQTLAILGENRHIPYRIVHLQTNKPAKKKVVIHLLHQLPLRADRVKNHQQRGTQQPLGGDRRTARVGIELLKFAIHPLQRPVHQHANLPRRMVGWYPLRQG